MNDWVVPRLTWEDSYQPDRGRVLHAAELERISKFFRYTPEDENHIAARTLPGVNSKGAFFTRGSGHNRFGGYTETPDEYQDVLDRLLRKHKSSAKFVPPPVIQRRGHSNIGVVTLGGCDAAVREALDILERRGIRANFMRIRGFPFDDSVEEFLASNQVNFIVEQNRDAQLRALLTLETGIAKEKLRSILVYGGFPLSAKHVIEEITHQIHGAGARPEVLFAMGSSQIEE
jgi:2-oxoglutarate ferredoxin oxidoreductase subunit alpha